MNTFLNEDGTPNISQLIVAFNRCAPTAPGGLAWLDQVRDCRWPGMFTDGRKHDIAGDPNGEAKPWDGASDCRPFVVDDIINELVDVDTVAFWRAMLQPGAADSEGDGYAVALAEWLIFTKMFSELLDEVELSSQYRHQYGWCVLAPRWRREIGMKRYTLTVQQIQEASQEAVQQLQQAQRQQQQGGQTPAAGSQSQMDPDALANLQSVAQLPAMIVDPSREDEAVKYLQSWYDGWVKQKLPADIRDRAPAIPVSRVRQCVQDLRTTGTCTAPLPYLCKNEPEVTALKPYEEIAVPNERMNAKELAFQIEWVTEAELKGRELTEDYDSAWVEAAAKHKGSFAPEQLVVSVMPIGLNGLLASGAATPLGATNRSPGPEAQLIRLIHAMYREADADGIPAVYLTTFHTEIARDNMGGDFYAKHGLMDGAEYEIPNVEVLRERRTRSLTMSRSVSEMTHTDQNLIKGLRDGIIDRQSITLLPPVNIYESPTGAKYKFGPAVRNYVKQNKEPEFMEMPSGQGLADAVETHNLLTGNLASRFGRMSGDVQPQRVQTSQENRVRRFLVGWTKCFKLVLNFYQIYGDDAEFAEVTGAPAGWLEARRAEPQLLETALDFDARELDPDLMLKRIETMNKVVLPNDSLGVVQRGKWAGIMTRSVMGPRAAKQLVQPLPDASQALQDKANNEVLKMFAGNQPNFVDKDDPTAASLLQFTQQIVMSNPNYLAALNDQALQAVAGQNAPAVVQQLGQQRNPNERFSALLMQWLKNLKFIGVTQVQNKETGALGVNPNQQPQ